MPIIVRYDRRHEVELIALLQAEPDWNAFTGKDSIEAFKDALLGSETFVCESQGRICGYLRALVDAFGVYTSELYVAPAFRGNGYGRDLLDALKARHPQKAVYVLSDEDGYYEKLGCKRVGSVFQL